MKRSLISHYVYPRGFGCRLGRHRAGTNLGVPDQRDGCRQRSASLRTGHGSSPHRHHGFRPISARQSTHPSERWVLCTLTGYDREEFLGRNCRFLQGEATREETVAEMGAAIEAQEPVTVDLRNYRKDGSMFWNRVNATIPIPILDDLERNGLETSSAISEDISG